MSARVLIACEFSGTVRDAFVARGFDAWSCDLLADERGSNRHIRGDVRDVLGDGWDLMIVAHPPCTRLCNSGVRWLSRPPRGKTLAQMWADLDAGAALFSTLWTADVPLVAIENPVMHRHAAARIADWRPPAQPMPFRPRRRVGISPTIRSVSGPGINLGGSRRALGVI